jgi:transcriptional regulator with XRE-family HTH domain
MAYTRQKTLRTSSHKKLIALLKEQRRKAGMSQKQVSELIGWPQSHFSKMETGERRLDVIEFIQICKALKADPQEIVAELTGI